MLVMSVKENEGIVFGNDVTITVLNIQRNKVKLGIVALKEITVQRKEIFDAIHGIPSAAIPGRRSIPNRDLDFGQLANEIDESGFESTPQETKDIMDDVMVWVSQQWGESPKS